MDNRTGFYERKPQVTRNYILETISGSFNRSTNLAMESPKPGIEMQLVKRTKRIVALY